MKFVEVRGRSDESYDNQSGGLYKGTDLKDGPQVF